MENEINLWEAVGNECLKRALELLKESADSADDDLIGKVKGLVDIAISIDEINYKVVPKNPF